MSFVRYYHYKGHMDGFVSIRDSLISVTKQVQH